MVDKAEARQDDTDYNIELKTSPEGNTQIFAYKVQQSALKTNIIILSYIKTHGVRRRF